MALVMYFPIVALTIALSGATNIGRRDNRIELGCNSTIYCKGELLKTIQLSQIFNDSKSYVDLSQRNDPDVTLHNFQKLMQETNNKPSRSQLIRYVNENFVANDELRNWTLPDWQENPALLKRIQDPKFRQWAKDLNDIWRILARKIDDDVAVRPNRHSLIYVENGFIVPGGRFKEFYYWDSYWVIEGLLLCGMKETARGMIDNFLYMVEKFGFIPNGGRVYYLMRSQPPLLIPMVEKYLEVTHDYDYLLKNIAILEREFDFWQREKTVQVQKNGKSYTMAHYVVNDDGPRPESYREDYNVAERLPENEKKRFYGNIKAGAESGWDFSARWFIPNDKNSETSSLTNIATEYIIPVDLNSILQRNAATLSKFHGLMRNFVKCRYYMKIARDYQDGIDNVLWNNQRGTWLDYNMKDGKSRDIFYPTNLTPLYTKSYDITKTYDFALRTINYLKEENVTIYFGGTPASLKQTGEQWDFPNAWPPLQSFVIMGLYRTGVKPAIELAAILAERWLRSNYEGYEKYGKMYEKYNAIEPGQGGGGGEYIVQEGFGWTNGVVFEFLDTFPAATSSDFSYFGWDEIEKNDISI